MQELYGSVRRSLVFRPSTPSQGGGDDGGAFAGFGGFVDKIGSSIRKSRIGFIAAKSPVKALPPNNYKENKSPNSVKEEDEHEEASSIRWRKGELIGCGAFGRVYMGMNLNSGELLAVKQVLIAVNGASKDKAQAHIKELEEEVKLLKNLSHPNIVRYLGTAREDDALNILLEFVPGGSISSLLGKFGSFPESVIRMYTKQLLLGLEYLHKNGIMHRDIKGANILVDNKGCIKLADFGASKKVVELATMTGAKSMKGTPYWMAPEVILQTGHNFSADIWSVGCTVIEMATGKPPWCQYQEVAALFHIGTTKSPPPIPEHLSADGKDFLNKCLQTEANSRASASELLQHPFVNEEYQESQPVFRRSVTEIVKNKTATTPVDQKSISNATRTFSGGLKDICNLGSVGCSTVYPENFSGTQPLWGTNCSDDDMCVLDDKDDFSMGASVDLNPAMLTNDCTESFNPMCEPNGDWACKFDLSPEVGRSDTESLPREDCGIAESSCNVVPEFTLPSEPLADDEEEVTEAKIRAFLEEKALDLEKLQVTLNTASPTACGVLDRDALSNLVTKSKSPSRVPSRRFSNVADVSKNASPVSHIKPISDKNPSEQLKEVPEVKELQKEGFISSSSFAEPEKQRLWKEELDKEIEEQREKLAERLRQAGGKTSSPNKRVPCQQRERPPFASPPK
ncbi:mitogen-activated protein kinase kinase kinase NPK1-like isoform X2 [Silene latifolia]|uniref:mitogen-activated protein kinase kinase kinase NPK1-like isoform X2 n=1 Tax=Silene latifolia TaxID=37657 RepID=UPI003D77B8C4